jgi:hypothetical protein
MLILNTNIETPSLTDIPVMLSASMPDELVGTPRAQLMFSFIVLFTQAVVEAGGKIVFGGHPGISPLVHEAVRKMNKNDAVKIFQLSRFKDKAPKEIWDKKAFDSINWIGDGKAKIEDDLAMLRDSMASVSKAAVFIGGKTQNENFSGKIPGIRDEYNRFLVHNPESPVYLIGLMRGETLNLVKEKNRAKTDSLSDKERRIIHNSDSIELIISLIIEDIARLMSYSLLHK